jgi:hypothetical protein
MITFTKLLSVFFVLLFIYSGVWAVVGLFVWVFCVSFSLEFSWWYVLGIWSGSILLNVLLPRRR